ncbi:MAG: gliding motility-associated C-terminal domain-containing protein [Flavobacteriia bacterium]|jgi:gliding motility-associated-like protein
MKTFFKILSLVFVFSGLISFESAAQRRTFPTSISINGAGTYCQFGASTQITIPAMPSSQCGSGANATVSNTTTIYSNTVNSTVGGTAVATLTNTSLTTNASFTPPTTTCGTTFYYAEVTWAADACAAAGTLTSGTIAVTVDCSCIAPNSDQTINTCGLTWYDSGGSAGNYSNNETYTVTFCPSTPGEIIVVDFNSFDVQGAGGTCNDMLDIWQAAVQGAAGTQDDRICGNVGAVRFVSTSPDGCITFEFRSDASTTRVGWDANVFCATPCTNPIAQLTDASMVSVCPTSALNAIPNSNTISVDASASTAGAGFGLTSYIWEWGDGTTTTTATPTTTHTYPTNSEIYVMKLRVADDNLDINATGCMSTNSVTKVIRILPEPDFTGSTVSPVNVTCGTNQNLVGILSSQTQTEFVPNPIVGTTILPDGSGVPFESTIDFSGYFNPGATMAAGCYPTVCFNIEHSFSQDLSIELVAPDGTSVIIFNEHQNGTVGTGPSVFGSCVNSSDLTPVVPGCGAEYCVVNSGGASWTGGAAVRTTAPATGSCTWTGACEATSAYYIPQAYNSSFSLSALNGVPLNGIWTLRITDNLAQDNGVLFSWSLDFPTSCFKTLETVTPTINTLSWTHSGTGPAIPAQTTNSTNITDPGPDPCQVAGTCTGNELSNNVTVGAFNTTGSFDYILTGTDQFGCQFEHIVTLNVSCPLNATLSGATSFCGSGSTTLTFTGTPNATVTYNINGGANLTIVLDATGTATLNTGVLNSTTNYNLISVTDGVTTTALAETETVTINPNPNADDPADVSACDSYTLPALTVGNYFTAANGGGTPMFAGDVINSTQTLFVFAVNGICTDENSFTITVNNTPTFSIGKTDPTACNASDGSITLSGLLPSTTYSITYNDGAVVVGPASFTTDASGNVLISNTLNFGSYTNFIVDLNSCPATDLTGVSLINPGAPDVNPVLNQSLCTPNTFTLPAITGTNLTGTESYYDGANGTGTVYSPGDVISSNITLFIFDNNGTCSDEESFSITITPTPVADAPANVAVCDSYTLPALTVGNYFTATNGGGTAHFAGDIINSTQTMFVFAANGTCTDENSFSITISTTPSADAPSNVSACDSYTLPALTVGNYFTATNGGGTAHFAGDIINSTQTMFVFAANGTCTDENSFTITINTTPIADAPSNVSTCDSYILPALSSGNYFTATNGGGTAHFAGDVINSSQTMFVFAANGTCTDENSFTITINTTPTADAPSNVSACDSYTLPVLTSGNYFTATNGGGTAHFAGDVINSSLTMFVYAANGTCTDENSFTITISSSPVVDAPANVNACDSYTLPALTSGNYFTATNGGGTAHFAGDIINSSQTLFVYAANGTCTDENSFTITINTTPTADAPSNVSVCGSYTLPALTSGNYFTATNGGGTAHFAGDVISSNQTMFVYAANGTCTDENSFTITITAAPVADAPVNVTACDTYTLPALAVGNYFTATNGGGTAHFAGDVISSSQTMFVFAANGTCTDENSFTITINTTPTADAPSNVSVCDSYTLPALTVGNYFTATNGGGTARFAGDVINSSQTIFVYAANGTCSDENFFTITINNTPSADDPSDVIACDTYTLPALAVGNYFTATNGGGTAHFAGDVISSTQTLFIFAGNGTCTDENTFVITVNPTPGSPSITVDTSYCYYEIIANLLASPMAGATTTWYSDVNLTNQLGTGNSLAPGTDIGTVTYYATQTLNGCESAPSQVTVTINSCGITVPTAFTPDGDLTNDTWHIENLNEFFPECRVTIYNRWGSQLFESIGYKDEWKGDYNGNDLPVGSYYYIIEFNDGKTENQNGTVSIIKNNKN